MQQEISNFVKVLYFFKCQNFLSRKISRAKFKSQHENQNNHFFTLLLFFISISKCYLKNPTPPVFYLNISLIFTSIRDQSDLYFLSASLQNFISLFYFPQNSASFFYFFLSLCAVRVCACALMHVCMCMCVHVYVCGLVGVVVVVVGHDREFF